MDFDEVQSVLSRVKSNAEIEVYVDGKSASLTSIEVHFGTAAHYDEQGFEVVTLNIHTDKD